MAAVGEGRPPLGVGSFGRGPWWCGRSLVRGRLVEGRIDGEAQVAWEVSVGRFCAQYFVKTVEDRRGRATVTLKLA